MNLAAPVRLFIIPLCVFLLSCESIYQKKEMSPYDTQTNVKALSDKLDEQIPDMMLEENIPGISINVIRNSRAILSKSFGVLSVKSNTIVNDETVFEFASLSKPVFALAVLQLSEKGMIDLDRPLYKYLENRKIDDLRYQQITARIVLSHSTGLPNWPSGNSTNLSFPPGERFQYSGMGYYYLQQVLEKITGKPLQQVVEEEVFIPLKMVGSSFVWSDQFLDNMAAGHSSRGEYSRSTRHWQSGVSASSLISNVHDYSRFLAYVLEEYKKGNPLIEGMVTPITPVKNDGEWGRLSWGLGWGIEETSDGKNIWHWGNNNEFRSLIVANLEKGIGLVYVSNSASGLKPVSYIIQNTIGGIHPLTRFRSVN